MATRKSKSRWFLRDLPRSYIVIAIAVAGAATIAVNINRSSPRPPMVTALAQPAKGDDESHFRGSIVFPSSQGGLCWTVTLDNRTGNLSEGGYRKCGLDKPSRVAKEAEDQTARLRALSDAFRR
ncbi:MAG TPA: hypothetical protein VFW22_15270 [Pseudolabrys sp.]|nr:hypothetical protein [Pseudolabrys sp.]